MLSPSKLSFNFFQDAEGDEEEDDDPDYQPPPVSENFKLISPLIYRWMKAQNNGWFRLESSKRRVIRRQKRSRMVIILKD